MSFDDKKASWEISLFFIAAAVLVIIIGKLGGTTFGNIFKNPVLQVILILLFVSIVYWLVRYSKVSRKKSLVVLAAIIIIILFVGISGMKFYVVASNSMKQSFTKNSLHAFWEKLGYSTEDFSKFTAPNGFQAGDLLIVKKTDDLKVGDIAVDTSRSIPLTHRIFFLNDTLAKTAGDADPPKNMTKILKSEMRPREHIYGKVWFVIPKGGIIRALYSCYLSDNCNYGKCFSEGKCGNR